MRTLVLSDLHIEFEPFSVPDVDFEAVILAGDIGVGTEGVLWARSAFPDVPVIYVMGNHEHYGRALPKNISKLKELGCSMGVFVLENDAFVLGDVVILGTSLWTDFALLGNPKMAGANAADHMTDYRRIRINPRYRRLTPLDTVGFHNHSRVWLAQQIEQFRGRRIVIVTHHAPSKRSLADCDAEDLLSAAYASHLDDFVHASGASAWVHGHIHVSRDYAIGQTRIVCNPKGYPDEYNNDFRPDFIVDI